jgi:hypothetical protein
MYRIIVFVHRPKHTERNYQKSSRPEMYVRLEKFPIALSGINLRKVEIYMYNFFPLHMIGI